MTIRVLCQADDYGITDAVSAGIRKAVKHGLVRNTGLFVNMPSSSRAAAELDVDVCLGQDFNLVTRLNCNLAVFSELGGIYNSL